MLITKGNRSTIAKHWISREKKCEGDFQKIAVLVALHQRETTIKIQQRDGKIPIMWSAFPFSLNCVTLLHPQGKDWIIIVWHNSFNHAMWTYLLCVEIIDKFIRRKSFFRNPQPLVFPDRWRRKNSSESKSSLEREVFAQLSIKCIPG